MTISCQYVNGYSQRTGESPTLGDLAGRDQASKLRGCFERNAGDSVECCGAECCCQRALASVVAAFIDAVAANLVIGQKRATAMACTHASNAAARSSGDSGFCTTGSTAPSTTETSGASIRLDQTRGGHAADEVSWTTAGGVDVPTGSGGLDPATDAASAAATGVVPRAECVHRPKNGRRTHNRGVIEKQLTERWNEKNIPFFRKLFSRAVQGPEECGLQPLRDVPCELKRIYETRSRPVWCTVKSRHEFELLFLRRDSRPRLSSGRSPAAPPP